MTVADLAPLGFTPVHVADETREITGIYCCDLLSIAMGRAPMDSVWLTVMGNLNAIAVAVLCDISVVIIAEGLTIDGEALAKAKKEGVNLFQTELPVFDGAKLIDSHLR